MSTKVTHKPTNEEPRGTGPPPVPGEAKGLKSHLLDTGASLLQHFKPIQRICNHVCAFHCYAHDASRQVRSHHFGSHVNEEMRQCVIYDAADAGARLIGVEYIISARLFEGLPKEERRYWHSHVYEVKSGQLMTPHVPLAAQEEEAGALVGTYGKTFHLWQVDRGDALPLGPPQLMMSFTADGQLDPALIAERDREFDSDTRELRRQREGLEAPPVHAEADHPWNLGHAWQVEMAQVPFTCLPAEGGSCG